MNQTIKKQIQGTLEIFTKYELHSIGHYNMIPFKSPTRNSTDYEGHMFFNLISSSRQIKQKSTKEKSKVTLTETLGLIEKAMN